jgi:hypothetical protein
MPRLQAVGRAQGHGADAPAAEVLLHLTGQVDRPSPSSSRIDRDGVVDLGELVLGNWASNVEPMTCVIVP